MSEVGSGDEGAKARVLVVVLKRMDFCVVGSLGVDIAGFDGEMYLDGGLVVLDRYNDIL